jgi:hypothetical protein
MSVNTMNFQQIATVLTSIVQQATGQVAITPTNTSEFVSVAQTALALGNDAVMNAISNVLSRTIFAIRPYSAKFAGLEKDLPRWGAYMRKLSIADSDWADDDAYKYPVLFDAAQTPADGTGGVVDQWRIKKPNVLQTNFFGASVYGDHITITEEQLETAFRSPEELGSFLSLIMTNLSNRLEMSRDATSRGLIANMIGALVAENSADRVVHLLTEYNAQTGLTLTATSVYEPDNFPAFMKWVYSRVAQISDMMTENSLMYQTVITGKPVLRHTPQQNQKVYLYSPARHQISARVLADTYHDSLLRYADVESVNFWQSIRTPDAVNVTPAYTNASGAVVTGSAVSQANIFGLMFDEDAMGYALLDRRMLSTPVNASGLYRNIWVHCKNKVFMDNTEKAVVLLLD